MIWHASWQSKAMGGGGGGAAAVRRGLHELRGRYRIMIDDLRKLLFKELQIFDASPASMAMSENAPKMPSKCLGTFALMHLSGGSHNSREPI